MTNKEILQADMLDILFEHRNKLYGAYALRKTYSRRLGLALGIALSIGLLFILMSFMKKKDNGDPERNRGDVVLIPLVLPDEKPKEPEPLKAKPKPPVANVDYQPPLIVPDDKVIEPLPDLNAIENANVSDKNSPGDRPDDIANTNTLSEEAGDPVVKETVKNDEPPLPSHGPSFPGGPAAWLKFLQRILQSPEDIEPGKRVEVLIRFWVDIDGSVSRPEIIRSGGEAFDREVLRVMKKMPKWDPAVQAGKPIAVAYQQPVIFIGEEQ